jgi:hypothetical protein
MIFTSLERLFDTLLRRAPIFEQLFARVSGLYASLTLTTDSSLTEIDQAGPGDTLEHMFDSILAQR